MNTNIKMNYHIIDYNVYILDIGNYLRHKLKYGLIHDDICNEI